MTYDEESTQATTRTFRIATIVRDGNGYKLEALALRPGRAPTQTTGDLGVSAGGMVLWMFAAPSNMPVRFEGPMVTALGRPVEVDVPGASGNAKGRVWALVNTVARNPEQQESYAYTIYVGKTPNADPADPDEWVAVEPAESARAPGDTGEVKMPP